LAHLVEYTGGRGIFPDREAALAAVGATVDGRVADCVAAQVPAALVSVIETHVGNAAVFELACLAIRNIACEEEGSPPLLAARAPSVIVESMRANAGSAEFAHYGCRALGNIACLPAGQYAAAAALAPAAVVTAINRHKDVADVAHYGCWALANIASISRVRALSLPDGAWASIHSGAPAIVAAMNAHMGVTDVAKNGCWALECIACIPAGAEAAITALAPAAIITAMMKHKDVADPLACGFSALNKISRLPGGALAVFAILCNVAADPVTKSHPTVITGFFEFITDAIEANRHSVDVLRSGLSTLCELALISVDPNAAASEICRLMRKFAGADMDVALYGIRAQWRIAECPKGKMAVAECGIGSIVNALKFHPGAAHISHCGFLALIHATRDFPTGQRAAALAGAPAVIVAAMAEHRKSGVVADYGCRALASMSSSLDAGAAVLSAGGVHAISAAINRHAAAKESGRAALAAIETFRVKQRVVSRLSNRDVDVRELVRVMVEFVNDEEVCAAVLKETTTRSQDDSTKQALADSGALAAIVAAMNKHEGVADVALSGCRALRNLVWLLEAGQEAAVDTGAPAAIISALRAFVANADMCENASAAIWNISVSEYKLGATTGHPERVAIFIAAGAVPLLVDAVRKFNNGCARGALATLGFTPDGAEI
jgi:hypothetical protein